MLIHHTNLDEHLDFLDEQNGHVFFLPRTRTDYNGWIAEVTIKILDSLDILRHTVIIVEQPTTHGKNFLLRRLLKRLGAAIEKEAEQIHQIHAFTVPSVLFSIVERAYEDEDFTPPY